MNIHIYKKRLRNANRRERELKKNIDDTKPTHKITKRKLKRKLYNVQKGKVNLRKKISKIREKKK